MTGKIANWNSEKNFGFIKDDETGQDYFFHVSGIKGETVQQSDAVTFEIEEGKKGLQAVEVQKTAH